MSTTPTPAPTPQAPADQTQAAQPEPKPTTEATPAQGKPDDKGDGGKDAILAELAGERDKRQALEAQFGQLRDGIAKAFGLKGDVTPEQAADTTRAAAIGFGVYRAVPQGVDPDALLDSTAFQAAIADVSPTDVGKLKARITEFVAAHPTRFRTTIPGAGAADATATGRASTTATMDDFIRGHR